MTPKKSEEDAPEVELVPIAPAIVVADGEEEEDDLDGFAASVKPRRLFALSTRGVNLYTNAQFAQGDAVVFGPETRGLPQALLDSLPPGQRLRLPMRPDNRSLNLSNAVAVVVYEAWRQFKFCGAE